MKKFLLSLAVLFTGLTGLVTQAHAESVTQNFKSGIGLTTGAQGAAPTTPTSEKATDTNITYTFYRSIVNTGSYLMMVGNSDNSYISWSLPFNCSELQLKSSSGTGIKASIKVFANNTEITTSAIAIDATNKTFNITIPEAYQAQGTVYKVQNVTSNNVQFASFTYVEASNGGGSTDPGEGGGDTDEPTSDSITQPFKTGIGFTEGAQANAPTSDTENTATDTNITYTINNSIVNSANYLLMKPNGYISWTLPYNCTEIKLTSSSGTGAKGEIDLYANGVKITDSSVAINATNTTYSISIPSQYQTKGTIYKAVNVGSGNTQFASFTYMVNMNSDDNAVATPFISFDKYTNTVTITGEEGTNIYYTTNGQDPTTSSEKYSAPFTISQTVTVKAIAEKDGKLSSVYSTTCTYFPAYDNFAGLTNAGANAEGKVNGPITFVYQSDPYLYAKDKDNGYMLIYGYINTTYTNGTTASYVAGKYSPYQNLPELTNPVFGEITPGGTPVEPEVVALKSISTDIVNHYVKIEGVKINNKNLVDGETTVALYERFKDVTIPETEDTYTVTGFVSVFGTTLQIYPVSFEVTSANVSFTINAAEGSDIEDAESLVKVTYTEKGETENVDSSVIVNPGTVFTLTPEEGYQINSVTSESDAATIAKPADATAAWTITLSETAAGETLEFVVTVDAVPVPEMYVNAAFNDYTPTDADKLAQGDAEDGEDNEYRTYIEIPEGEFSLNFKFGNVYLVPAADGAITFDNGEYTGEYTEGDATSYWTVADWAGAEVEIVVDTEAKTVTFAYTPETADVWYIRGKFNNYNPADNSEWALNPVEDENGVYSGTFTVDSGEFSFNFLSPSGSVFIPESVATEEITFTDGVYNGRMDLAYDEDEEGYYWEFPNWTGGEFTVTIDSNDGSVVIKTDAKHDTDAVNALYRLTEDDAIYNLQGVKVSNPVKGQIYIINGKKAILR